MFRIISLFAVVILCNYTVISQELIHITQNMKQQLRGKLGSVSVVMLGEPSHGEGNIMEMNIDIIKYLHEEMGFNTIAFESGFYDLYKAQKIIDSGGNLEDAVKSSIFPIWTSTCEFQELIEYIHENRAELKIVGFDCQLTGDYSISESLDDLQDLFKSNDLESEVDFEFLQHVFISLGEDFTFPVKSYDYHIFVDELQKIERQLLILQRNNIEDIDVWLQFIKSTSALAKNYFENKPSSFFKEEWKAWMSNPRDAQMADNLLFFLKKHPDEKVVCWGASTHFANDFTSTKNKELTQFKPMGGHLKQQLNSKLYSIAPITSSGTYGAFKVEDIIKNISYKSIEFELAKDSSFHQFINLNDSKFDRPFISYAIDYTPLTADWEKIFDAFIFIKSVNPSTLVSADCVFKSDDKLEVKSDTNVSQLKSMLPLQKFTEKIKGRLTDENNKDIPFANILIKNTTIGTISNETGYFQLNYPKELEKDTLSISCIGYESVALAINKFVGTIKLQSKDFVLNEVTINAKSLDPKFILKKAIENIPSNYIQEDYNAEFYSRGMMKNFDSLIVDVEHVAKLYDENGYDSKYNITNRRIAYKRNRFNRGYVSPSKSLALSPYYLEKMDLVSISPLFKRKNIKKYDLNLIGTCQYEREKVYKIAFKSKYKSLRYTGTYYIGEFTGTIYINSNDYSIVKLEVRWLYNLDKLKWDKTFNTKEEYIDLDVSYKKHKNGNYFFNVAKYLRSSKGVDTATNEYWELTGWQTVYVSHIELNDIDKIPDRSYIPFKSKKLVKGEQFWNRYNKPAKNE